VVSLGGKTNPNQPLQYQKAGPLANPTGQMQTGWTGKLNKKYTND
jgi:hypothetical protein